MKKTACIVTTATILSILISCSKNGTTVQQPDSTSAITSNANSTSTSTLVQTFGSNIDLTNLYNYANQSIPNYITKTNSNVITNPKATLGRVLFYDPSLSVTNTVSCSSCHHQNFAFGDTAIASKGVLGGLTTRHSMRLVNNRFEVEAKYFWDERATSLENQIPQPIENFSEMGYSGTSGRPTIDTLLTKLARIPYYKPLFKFVYGDTLVTTTRLQECISQFIRSIQSFDSKFDAGRAVVSADSLNFPNYTTQQNLGKTLFLTNPVFDQTGNRIAGGVGCNNCHKSPEFDIDPNTKNNGVIATINSSALDVIVVKSPSLRNITKPDGSIVAPLMHNGNFTSLGQVIAHYGNINITPGNTNLDKRLTPNGFGQKLNLTVTELNALVSFLQTLSGNAVYTDPRWSNPFLN